MEQPDKEFNHLHYFVSRIRNKVSRSIHDLTESQEFFSRRVCNKEKKKKKKKNDEFWRCAVGQGTGGKLSGMRSFKLGQSRRNAGSWAGEAGKQFLFHGS